MHDLIDFILSSSLLLEGSEHEKDTRSTQLLPRKLIRIKSTSVIGNFIHNMGLKFALHDFRSSVSLWYAFARFRFPTLTTWQKRKFGADYFNYHEGLKCMQSSKHGWQDHKQATDGNFKLGPLTFLVLRSKDCVQRQVSESITSMLHGNTKHASDAPSIYNLTKRNLLSDTWATYLRYRQTVNELIREVPTSS